MEEKNRHGRWRSKMEGKDGGEGMNGEGGGNDGGMMEREVKGMM